MDAMQGERKALVPTGHRRTLRPRSAPLLAFAAVGALALLWVAGAGAGHVLVRQVLTANAAGQNGMESLLGSTVKAKGCAGTSAVGTVQGTNAARGTITISLPRTCRGHANVAFDPALHFADANADQGAVGLLSSAWSGNLGTVGLCFSKAAGGCTSSTITVTSATTPPLQTSLAPFVVGTNYGPQVLTTLAVPGTVTLVILLNLQDNLAGPGTPAVYQQMQVIVSITQN